MSGAISVFGNSFLDPVYANRAPLTTDNQYQLDQEWVDQSVVPCVIYKLRYVDWAVAPYPADWMAIGASDIKMYDVTDPDLIPTAATMTIATATITTAAAHNLRVKQAVVYDGVGLPAELVAGVTYYVYQVLSPLTYSVSAVKGVAPAITFVAGGVGTYTTLNGAVDTPIVDFYDGVNITTTQPQTVAGQILQDPSDIAAHHVFTVVNTDASTDPITIYNGTGPVSTILLPGQAQKYIWDGAEWTLGTGIDAEDIDYTPHGEVPDVNVQAAIDKLIDIRWMKRFYNASGGILAANKIQKLNGYDAGSTEAFIIPVTATADVPCGFLTAAIGIGTTGYALIKGEVLNVMDTSAGVINDPVYFTATGDLTLIPGSAVIGRVLTVGNPGTVFIDIPADASSGKLTMTTATDPALNGIDITFIDPFDGVVVTLTAAGNSQTLPAPTDLTAGKEFTIAVKTGVAHGLPVVHSDGTRVIYSGEHATFVWTGAAWNLKGKKLVFDPATDPAINAGTSTARVDAYDGVVITLTAAGNSQTIQPPTDIAKARYFTVIVTAASGAFFCPVTYGGGTILIHASEAQTFAWDGSEWCVASDSLFTDNGEAITPKDTSRTLRAATTSRLVTRVEAGIIPAAATYTNIGLVVPVGHTVKDATVTAVNLAVGTARYVRIAHVLGGAPIPPVAPNAEMFICYDYELGENACLGWTIPTIAPGDIIAVYADGANVTFRISGNDIAATKSDQIGQTALADAALNDIFTMIATDKHLEEVKIVNRSAVDTVVTIYAKEAATAAAVDAIMRFEIPANLWATLRDLETYNIYLTGAQKLSAQAAVGGRINIVTYAKG